MKKTIFLVLVGASFALCNCQQQTTPATIEAPVAPPPIKVTAEKNEITPVTIGGALAPSSLNGKTIVFNFSNAMIRHGNLDDFGAPSKYTSAPKSISIGGKNKYSKTGSNTAKIELDDPMAYVGYDLKFTSANSGTATHTTSSGDYTDKVTGITFTIK